MFQSFRRVRRAAVGALSAFALIVVASTAAQAHAILVDSTPPANGSVPAGHEAIVLRYNSRLDVRRSRVTLTAPDRSQAVLTIDQSSKPGTLAATADLKPGAYTLHWEVLALDGHITRGDVPFSATGN
jgi:methionine-rich copper-binding protein CopC